jgi:dihydroneopterin aldolase/2-amino-4-hydroxy-6-hydroxymethyldihydropteridine diphosphokinase/dihydropteroate synthase
MSDRITISNLSIHLPHGLGPSAFGLTPPPPCPISLDLIINLHPTLIPLVAGSDSMSSLGVNYSSVSKAIYHVLSSGTKTFGNAEEVMELVAGIVLNLECVDSVHITLGQSRALLHAQGVRYAGLYTREGEVKGRECEIRDLRVSCVVGLHPHERGEKQRLEVDLKIKNYGQGKGWNYKVLHDTALSVRLDIYDSRHLLIG